MEKHLQNRPDAQELKDRHILLDSNAAPGLQAKQQELERQMRSDSLEKVGTPTQRRHQEEREQDAYGQNLLANMRRSLGPRAPPRP